MTGHPSRRRPPLTPGTRASPAGQTEAAPGTGLR